MDGLRLSHIDPTTHKYCRTGRAYEQLQSLLDSLGACIILIQRSPLEIRLDKDLFSIEIRNLIREDLARTVGGSFSSHKDHPYFVAKHYYEMKTRIEGLPLYPRVLPEVLLDWAGMPSTTAWSKEDFLVLDLETSGLGRSGTIAIMIGLGYYENERYVVEQIFLPEPEAELSSFDRLIELLEQKSVFITFNGKSFDIPVLQSRLLYNQIWLPLGDKEHLDLLHMARRLWKNRAPNCALETLEYYILGHIRDAEMDIEGSDIPQTYFQYLINGDPSLIKRIFVHNEYDILHTAALFALIADSISLPVKTGIDPRIDYLAVANLYLKEGRNEVATSIMKELYDKGERRPQLLCDLGMRYKKLGDKAEAYRLFSDAAALRYTPALLEHAKLAEAIKDFSSALDSCRILLQSLALNPSRNERAIQRLQHRMDRLELKIRKANPVSNSPEAP